MSPTAQITDRIVKVRRTVEFAGIPKPAPVIAEQIDRAIQQYFAGAKVRVETNLVNPNRIDIEINLVELTDGTAPFAK